MSYRIDLLRPTPLDKTLLLFAEVPDLGVDSAAVTRSIVVDHKPTAIITSELRRLWPRE